MSAAQPSTRPARRLGPVLAAAAVGFCVPGVYLAAWDLFVEQSTCRTQTLDSCMGAPIAMTLVGLPVLYLVWAVAMRATGARMSWLVPLVGGLALFVLTRMVGGDESSPLVYLAITTLVSGVWRAALSPEP
jgi:hypothetical protein